MGHSESNTFQVGDIVEPVCELYSPRVRLGVTYRVTSIHTYDIPAILNSDTFVRVDDNLGGHFPTEFRLVSRAAPPTNPTNPKDAIGSHKVALSLWPAAATAQGALALMDGAHKYGRANYRATKVRASIYVDAVMRHLACYNEGEEVAEDSGITHLGHALAGLAILVDAQACGTLIDDRPYAGGFSATVQATNDLAQVIATKERTGEAPKDWTRMDMGAPQ